MGFTYGFNSLYFVYKPQSGRGCIGYDYEISRAVSWSTLTLHIITCKYNQQKSYQIMRALIVITIMNWQCLLYSSNTKAEFDIILITDETRIHWLQFAGSSWPRLSL